MIDTQAAGDTSALASTRVRAKRKRRARRAARVKTIAYGSGRTSDSMAGRLTVTIRPSSAARAALKSRKKLSVSVALTFQAAGGSPVTQSRHVTVKAARKHKRKKR